MKNPIETFEDWLPVDDKGKYLIVLGSILFSNSSAGSAVELKKDLTAWLHADGVNLSKSENLWASIIRLRAIVNLLDEWVALTSNGSYFTRMKTYLQTSHFEDSTCRVLDKFPGIMNDLTGSKEYWSDISKEWLSLRNADLSDKNIAIWSQNQVSVNAT